MGHNSDKKTVSGNFFHQIWTYSSLGNKDKKVETKSRRFTRENLQIPLGCKKTNLYQVYILLVQLQKNINKLTGLKLLSSLLQVNAFKIRTFAKN